MVRRVIEFNIEENSLVDKGANGSKIYCIKRFEGVAPDPSIAACKRLDAVTRLSALTKSVDINEALTAGLATVAEVVKSRESAGELSDYERAIIHAEVEKRRGDSLGKQPDHEKGRSRQETP